MTDGADAPVEGEPDDLPPPEPKPDDESGPPDGAMAAPPLGEVAAPHGSTLLDSPEGVEPVERSEPVEYVDAVEPVEYVEPDAVAEDADTIETVEPLVIESAEPIESDEPLVAAVPPRRGPVAVQDRGRTLLGVATVVALAAACFFGLRLIGLLTDDEAGASSPSVDGPVGELVPFVVALAEPPSSPGAPDVLASLNSGRHDIAVDTDVAALCATVALDDELDLAGRWEHNGEIVASTASSELAEPGFADCVTADGEALPDGTYQFVVTDGDAVSAPGTVVLGTAAVAQRFVNETEDAVCAIRVAPLRAGYFDVFDTEATPVEPGGSITLALADVRSRLEAVACDDGEVVSRRLFRPDAVAVRTI